MRGSRQARRSHVSAIVPIVGAGIDDPDVTDVADDVRLLVGLALSEPYSGMHFLRN